MLCCRTNHWVSAFYSYVLTQLYSVGPRILNIDGACMKWFTAVFCPSRDRHYCGLLLRASSQFLNCKCKKGKLRNVNHCLTQLSRGATGFLNSLWGWGEMVTSIRSHFECQRIICSSYSLNYSCPGEFPACQILELTFLLKMTAGVNEHECIIKITVEHLAHSPA